MSGGKNFIERHLKGDPVIWAVVLFLSLFSILVVYSTTGSLAYRRLGGNTEYYLIKHTILTFISISVMWLMHRIDYQYYHFLSKIALWCSLPLLLLTLRFGVHVNEATRWIVVPFIEQSFQPSDFAKLALFIHIAGVLAKYQRHSRERKAAMLPILFWTCIICSLVAISDLSQSLLIVFTVFLMMFIGRVSFRYLLMLTVIVFFSSMAALFAGERKTTAINRIRNFVEEGPSYQMQQSYIAIMGGGWMGKGPGKSDQRHLLPHSYSDFIYAIILEEYGYVGGLAVLFAYILLLYRGSQVLMGTQRAFGGLLSVSLCIAVVTQALINMCVSVGLLPVTGLPLPMVSMGGTSQLFMGVSMGIVLSVSRYNMHKPLGEGHAVEEAEEAEENEQTS